MHMSYSESNIRLLNRIQGSSSRRASSAGPLRRLWKGLHAQVWKLSSLSLLSARRHGAETKVGVGQSFGLVARPPTRPVASEAETSLRRAIPTPDPVCEACVFPTCGPAPRPPALALGSHTRPWISALCMHGDIQCI